MGSAESIPVPATRATSRRERRLTTSFDEKFEALRIEYADGEQSVDRLLFAADDSERIDRTAVLQYVKRILQDRKNQLGLSALSANNPATILEKPSTLIRDTQFFNVKIPLEGSPVGWRMGLCLR
jgi:bleomycin hydrolase